ncbi:hypothetical protein B0H11DRAFT_1934532, partial [Mycena galericulata]
MPSLFSRARTASTPGKHKPQQLAPPLPPGTPTKSSPNNHNGGGADEFGVGGRGRALSLGHGGAQESGYGAVGFLPTTLPADPRVPWAAAPPSLASSTSSANSASASAHGHGQGAAPPRAAYGLLSPARDAVLGLPDAARLVATVCEQLERTGVATPFVFSALALDVRRAGVVRLVDAFLGTCADSGSTAQGEYYADLANPRAGKGMTAERRWADEARFAGPHELGMCLRWGLSRVVRVEGGREVRGLLSWAWYERWRAEEAVLTALPLFLPHSFPTPATPVLVRSLPLLPPRVMPVFPPPRAPVLPALPLFLIYSFLPSAFLSYPPRAPTLSSPLLPALRAPVLR